MRRLMEDTGETANLGIEKDGAVLFLNQVETHSSIRAFFPPGTLSPLHASGIGKALIAHMSPDRMERTIRRIVLERYTDRTITDLPMFKSHLDKIRCDGYSFDNEERNVGMRCIAAPVFDMNREVISGISISGPSSRILISDVERLSVAVIEAAQALTQAIGGVRLLT